MNNSIAVTQMCYQYLGIPAAASSATSAGTWTRLKTRFMCEMQHIECRDVGNNLVTFMQQQSNISRESSLVTQICLLQTCGCGHVVCFATGTAKVVDAPAPLCMVPVSQLCRSQTQLSPPLESKAVWCWHPAAASTQLTMAQQLVIKARQ